MSIPSFFEFIEPLLRYLAEHPDGVRSSDAYDAVANRVGLSSEQLAMLLPSGGQEIYKNRIGWAHDRLKRDGLSRSVTRGRWCLTEKGRTYAMEHRDSFPKSEVERLAFPSRGSRLGGPTLPVPDPPDPGPKSPTEMIDEAVAQIRDSAATEILGLIAQSSPTFFEQLVLDLLHRMGYGASRDSLQRVGGSGDGGIDGIISLDRLGLEKVYVQAKRWQGSVGRPEIQAFFGTLAGRRADKGVFITTSSFTRDAVEFARGVSDSIVLVDGPRLTELMIDHGVGVSHAVVKVPSVDRDYFEEL